MKHTRGSTFWAALGILVLSLLAISATLVLAKQTAPSATEDTWIADAGAGQGGRDLYDGTLAASTPVTVYMPLMFLHEFEAFSYLENFDNPDDSWPYGSGFFDYGYRKDNPDLKEVN